ncbi:hypothetical protein FIU94_15125 [Sulfitobacter sp. THAF37]|uniref:DUF4442 domain-containing protein n=1 Tax=Sulfitobacter sp. THAF37 TaxID=2587855 RepID=UPI001268F884|nr:DUF4442 domain-containing protein [Sulfitobacter sp. THAF37]QFT60160.1 hypothetical protein FIU94_15125 [Sulfitobacter sp. THAF37]
MTPFDMIKTHLDSAVPFATHTGVELLTIADGTASARLVQRQEVSNHIKSMHAGAMFTLGEAASGAAVAGALAPMIFDLRPVAASAQIGYLKVALGTLTAHAETSEPGGTLLERIRSQGKAAFDVTVDIRDEGGDSVAEMTVNWHVSAARR